MYFPTTQSEKYLGGVLSVPELLVSNIQELKTAGLSIFLQGLPQTVIRKVHSYRQEEDRLRVLLGFTLLRFAVWNRWGRDVTEEMMEAGPWGKPRLRSVENFEYNLSHSGNFAVLLLDRFPVGVDIEAIDRVDWEVAKCHYSENEYSWLQKLEVASSANLFYRLWTYKESCLKASGKGLSGGLRETSFRMDSDGNLLPDSPEAEKWYFKEFRIDKDYALTACLSRPFPDLTWKRITVEDLVRWAEERKI